MFERMCMGHCAWVTIPLLPWPTLLSLHSCVDALHIARTTPHAELTSSWKKRHVGLEAAPKNPKVGSVRYRPCSLGVCVCRPGFEKTMLQRLVRFVKTVPDPFLIEGDVVLVFKGFELASCEVLSKEDEEAARDVGNGLEKVALCVHVALTQLKPFKMTFLELQKADTVGAETWFTQTLVDGTPCCHTMYEFVGRVLRPHLAWDVQALQLSTRDWPVARIVGWACALRFEGRSAERLWAGSLELQKAPRRRRPAHDMLEGQLTARSADGPENSGQP